MLNFLIKILYKLLLHLMIHYLKDVKLKYSKNELIVLVYHQLIDHHVVQFVVLDVADFLVVVLLICLIEVVYLDLIFGIKIRYLRKKNNCFCLFLVAVVDQVISIHLIKTINFNRTGFVL